MTTTLDALTITKLSVGPMDNNAYLLRCKATGATLMIDAANDADRLLELCDGTLDAVLTTHQHADHWQALADVVEATGARTYAGTVRRRGHPRRHAGARGRGRHRPIRRDRLEAIHLVGHTPGSIALLYDGPAGPAAPVHRRLPVPRRVLEDNSDPTDFASLIDGVEEKVFDRLPDETVVYPGHGADTTLGKERSSIPEWRARGW